MTSPLELLGAHLDGKLLSQEDSERLTRWVVEDAANATMVVEFGILHEHLDDLLSVPRLLEELAENGPSPPGPGPQELIDPLGKTSESMQRNRGTAGSILRPSTRYWGLVSLAACLLIGIGAVVWHGVDSGVDVATPLRDAPQPSIVATLTESIGVDWNLDQAPIRGTNLRADERVELANGLLVLTTSAGCDVLLESPCVAVIDGANRVTLLSGKLTARVDGVPDGLTVTTPTAKVVDLGTEFGVRVDPEEGTYVAVYEGKVSLTSKQDSPSGVTPSKLIPAGRTGRVSSGGEMSWVVETPPHNREFVRFDEITAVRQAHSGARDAQQQVCFYKLQRVPGLLGYYGFDVPSEGAGFSMAFRSEPITTEYNLSYSRDLQRGRLYTSGAVEVAAGQSAFLIVDASPESPLARAGLLNDQGMVGRSATELWMCWRTESVSPHQVGEHAGLSLMFGGNRTVHESLFFGESEGQDALALVANVGSRVSRRLLDTDPTSWAVDTQSAGEESHLWLARIRFAERADKVSVWCDIPPSHVLTTRPLAEVGNANVIFNRVLLSVGQGNSAWRFDDILMALTPEAISEGLSVIYGSSP